jgi:hypothetical protein
MTASAGEQTPRAGMGERTAVHGLTVGAASPLSVLDAISLPPLNVAEVLAGRASLAYHNVRWVQVMHWPSDDFIRPGDLVLTTGVAPTPEDSLEFLLSVARSDAAALIVSAPPGTRIAELLPPVTEVARQRGFPVLALPWEIPFADVTRTILTSLLRTGCTVNEAACGLRHGSLPAATRDEDMTLELSRAMALRAESAPVAVALGHPGNGPSAAGDFSRTVDELQMVGPRERVNLRLCLRPEVCLIVVEGLPRTTRLRELLDQARHRAGDASTNWVVADQRTDDPLEPSDERTRSVEVARDIMRQGDDWVASQSLESLFVLGAMAQSPLISTVVTEAVGALVNYDRRNRRNLLETLQVFLDESCNTSAAARRLFLNRHSLMYRLRKIEELTGFSLKEPADRFFLQACVRLYRYRLVGDSPE